MPNSPSQPLNKWHYLLVLIAGALTVFAFAPFNVYPFAWLTPAVLFYTLIRASTRKQYFTLSFLFGIGLFGAGASWPFYSMYYFAHAPLPMALGASALFVAVLALFSSGLFGLLAATFRNTPVLSRLLLFYPASWVFIEWTRDWLFTGFPWLYLGYSQIDTSFSGFAPITGVLGLSWICVLFAGSIISFKFAHKPDETRLLSSARVLPALLGVVIAMSAWGLSHINWTSPVGKPFTASVLQGNISQNEKLDPDNLDAMIALYQDMTQKAWNSDLIVWPETALFATFNNHMDTVILPLQQSHQSTPGARDKTLLIGGFFVNDQNGVENSVLAITAENRQLYSKRHLVPFGEYIPLLDYIRWLGQWIQLPYSNIAAGNNDGTLELVGQTAQLGICYEDAFGDEVIQSLPRATLLVNVTHDGWFTGSFEAEQHMQIARMRSLETGRYMVRATTTGPSGIINTKGKLVATAPTYTRKIITHSVQPMTGTTPFIKWGNWLMAGLSGLVVLFGVLLARRCNND
jgi:apolipoprotein N-acyltransferase